MNVILVTHLETVRNCDAKNLSVIIDDYAQYTDLEELFHEAIVERSLKTGYEDPSRYVDENRILDFFRNPWNYRGLFNLDRLLHYFLQEQYYSESKLGILNDLLNNIFSTNLKDYIYKDFEKSFKDEDNDEEEEDPVKREKNYNTCRHLEWLSINYCWEFRHVVKQHTKLTGLEIEMLLGICEEHKCRYWL